MSNSPPSSTQTTTPTPVSQWLQGLGIEQDAAQLYAKNLDKIDYTAVSDFSAGPLTDDDLIKAGIVSLKHRRFIIKAQGPSSMLRHIKHNGWGWQRDLTMECVESNPGPAMVLEFTRIANQFGEGTEEARRIRESLQQIETAIKAWKPDEYAYTDVHVKQFFTEKTAEDIRGIVGDAAVATIWHEVRAHFKLDQSAQAVPPVPSGPSSAPGAEMSKNLPRRYPVGVPFPDRDQYFLVDRTLNPNIKQLLAKFESGGWFLLHGPRQSSKTTTIQQCKRKITDFDFIYFSMEDVDQKLSFFQSFSEYMASHYPALPYMVPTKLGFVNYFVSRNFPHRKVILVIDELDYLLALSDKDDVLMALRSAKLKAQTGDMLHTFVGLGTMGMIELLNSGDGNNSEYISPFNVSEFSAIPNFSREEHKNLHIAQAQLPELLEEEIWFLTNGKPGASTWFGSEALKYIRSPQGNTLEGWMKKKRTLISLFAQTTTMQRMLQSIDTDVKEFLVQVLRQNKPRHLFFKQEEDFAKKLAASGAVILDTEENTITPAAPIIQQVILFHMDVVAAPPLGGVSPPLKENGSLDIFQALCIAVNNFHWEAVLNSHSTKDLRVPPFRTQPIERQIADERAFQTELIYAFRALLLRRLALPVHICIPEAKEKTMNTQDRLDILLENHAIYALELCANVDTSGVKEHIKQCARYAKYYTSDENYCINFVGFDYTEIEDYPEAGVYEEVLGQTTYKIELIHVRYYDSIAFPQERGDTTIIGGSQSSRVPRVYQL